MKPYDLEELFNELKDRGLYLAEDAIETVYDATSAWLVKSAIASKTPLDDIVAVVIPAVNGIVKENIDKIDGKKG